MLQIIIMKQPIAFVDNFNKYNQNYPIVCLDYCLHNQCS